MCVLQDVFAQDVCAQVDVCAQEMCVPSSKMCVPLAPRDVCPKRLCAPRNVCPKLSVFCCC